jgi:trans-2,3-dihydro-3-hydroxyanthranilate isomerase
MRTLRYVRCDVFTDTALTGNALAVFTDARALPEATMQAIAREMNLSETVFVHSPEAGGQAKIRIFTPTRELPFAGHPTLGSAFVLGGFLQAEVVRLETGIGVIPVRLEREGAKIVFGWMEQRVPTWRAVESERERELLAALGVAKAELPIVEYDNGMHHLFVVVDSESTVRGLKPDLGRLAEVGDFGVSVLAVSDGGAKVKTRMFAPSHGVNEDPATGSAAGPLAVHLARHGRAPFGTTLEIRQGEELARPSTLYAVAHGAAEQIERVEVGGAAVVIGRGELRVP